MASSSAEVARPADGRPGGATGAAAGFRAALYILFMLSGAAGLFYEMAWSRYLAIFLGHSAYAQTLVIAIFLGGMAIGALWMGSRSTRLRDPLIGYAAVELAAGAIGLFFHEIYLGVTGFAHGTVFPGLAGGPLLTVTKWALAAALILPQSVLLGATFPFMTAGLIRRFRERPGRTLALAYFANSLGAAAGVLVAGFYLVSLAGLPGTVIAAAILNLIAALATILLARARPAPGPARGESVVADARDPAADGAPAAGDAPAAGEIAASKAGRGIAAPALARLLLAVSFGTAVASFAYEIGWLRMLALVLGSATHSFELMLSAFILGLALGSLAVRGWADRWRDPLRALGFVQWAMGLSALATLALYGASFEWMAELMRAFDRTDAGYVGFTLARYAICLAIMLPASFCAGMTLPLITRTLLVRGMGEAAIGKVYGTNTLGSIVGVAAAALVLLPWLGLKGLIVAGAGLDMALGVAILVIGARAAVSSRPADRERPGDGEVRVGAARRTALGLAYAAAIGAVLAIAAAAVSDGFDRRLLISGVYRHGDLTDADTREVRFYADGRTATVGVRAGADGHLAISTNGKADASLGARWFGGCDDSTVRRPLAGDESTQLLLPMVTLAHAPHARRAAVIGLGSGMSSHFLLASPTLEDVVTIEIEPQMVRGSREFYPANRRVFDDPRSRIAIDDARTYFASSGRRFDYIFSEPSNPWVSGVASLFTTEFYAQLETHLASDGVFGQWIHLYEIDDGLVLSILAAIHRHFGDYRLYQTASYDMLVVATPGPSLPDPDWSVFDLPELRSDLCHAPPLTASVLDATRLMGRRALLPILEAWPQPNSEFYPVVDLLAERTRYLRSAATGFVGLALEPFDIAAALTGERSGAPVGGSPALSLPRVRLAARAAAMRDVAAAASFDTAFAADGLREALYRRQRWEALLASGAAPSDWRAWLEELGRVRTDLTAGTAADPPDRFYAAALRFMRRHHAPESVRMIVEFQHALDGWRFARAATLADEIAAANLHEDGMVSADLLSEGGVVAKLRTGDAAGARALYDRLAPHRRRHPGDLRARMLTSYLEMLAPVSRAPPIAGSLGRP